MRRLPELTKENVVGKKVLISVQDDDYKSNYGRLASKVAMIHSEWVDDKSESNWIYFYPWDSNFIVNCAEQLGVDILDIRTDSHKNRLYFVWRTK